MSVIKGRLKLNGLQLKYPSPKKIVSGDMAKRLTNDDLTNVIGLLLSLKAKNVDYNAGFVLFNFRMGSDREMLKYLENVWTEYTKTEDYKKSEPGYVAP